MHIAMWSGPRNLSTAMMYSFGNRPDTTIWDEPFYAAYLKETGLNHPHRREIITTGEPDPHRIKARCIGPIPEGKTVFYQKHMTHHMLPGFPLDWLSQVTNIFLIRHPAHVIASYHAKRENPVLDDIGYRQQARIFDALVEKGQMPVVIESADILKAPEAALQTLCKAINLPYSAKMLSWPAGGHASDGIWGSHWYGAVHNSTGFAKSKSGKPSLSANGQLLCEQALPYFEHLSAFKLKPAL